MKERIARKPADVLCRPGYFYKPIMLALRFSKNSKLNLSEAAAELPGWLHVTGEARRNIFHWLSTSVLQYCQLPKGCRIEHFPTCFCLPLMSPSIQSYKMTLAQRHQKELQFEQSFSQANYMREVWKSNTSQYVGI